MIAPLDHHGSDVNRASNILLELVQLNFTILIHIEALKDQAVRLGWVARGVSCVLLSIGGPVDDSGIDSDYGGRTGDDE